MAATIVINGGESHRLDGDAVLFVGRSSDIDHGIIGLDPMDNGISRRSLEIRANSEGTLLTNVSSKISVFVDQQSAGRLTAIRPGGRLLAVESLGIEVRGLIRTHRIEVLPEASGVEPAVWTGHGAETVVQTLAFTEAELDALTALFNGYLRQFPRRDCQPATYDEAGRLLGLPGSTVRRRIEHLRERLKGIEVYIEGASAREELAAYVFDNAILTPQDLDRLGLDGE